SLQGSQVALSVKGGSGNNSLVGPAEATNWIINGANSGTFNRKHLFSGMKNVVSGSADDKVFVKPGGSLAGNLDGGPGIDTLYYQTGMAANVIAGQVLNFESTSSFAALTVTNPGSNQFQAGAPITSFTI